MTMNYLDEMENAKRTYESKMATAKEKWVNSSNNWHTTNEYDKELLVANEEYNTSIKLIRKKYSIL